MTTIEIVQPTVELIKAEASDLDVIHAMVISTQGDPVEWDDTKDSGRINFLMKGRHGSPFEHNMFKFRVEAPIAVFREWHRHRIGFSYNEVSGRYSEMKPRFYIPPPERPLVQKGKAGAYIMMPGSADQYHEMFREMYQGFQTEYERYQRLLDLGIAKEVARGVLPVYLMSSMYVTCNARSLMSFLSLRTDEPDSTFPSKPMWEIDVPCARACEAAFADAMPVTYQRWNENGRVAP